MTSDNLAGQIYRSDRLLHSYYNIFPTVACFRSCLTAEQRWLSHFSLNRQWQQHLATHQALTSLPHHYQRALAVLYDESYQFRPGTLVGKLYDDTRDILGKTHRLLLLQPLLPDIKQLSHLYLRLSKSQLTPADRIMVFKIGEFIRNLYQQAHAAFYQAYLLFNHGVG